MVEAYLAGSIEGLAPDEAENWRSMAFRFLTHRGIECFNPYLAYEQPIPEEKMEEVWSNNVHWIKRCPIFLCKLNPNGRSVGSIRELQIAKDLGKAIYLVDEHLYYGPKNSVWDIPLFKDLLDALFQIELDWVIKK